VTKSLPDSEEVNDILLMSCYDNLTLVNPSTTTGRAYILSDRRYILLISKESVTRVLCSFIAFYCVLLLAG